MTETVGSIITAITDLMTSLDLSGVVVLAILVALVVGGAISIARRRAPR